MTRAKLVFPLQRGLIRGHLEMHAQLEEAAFNGQALGDACSGNLVPPGWDSPAFASNLAKAYYGLGIGLSGACSSELVKVLDEADPKGSLQKSVYEFLKSTGNSRWPALVTRRVQKLCDAPDFKADLSCFRSQCSIVKTLSTKARVCVLKSWINSWYTPTRITGGHVFKCIFGCEDGQDELGHYLICDVLWTIIIGHSTSCLAELCCPSRKRLCLDIDSQGSSSCCDAHALRQLAIAYQLYHFLAKGHSHLVLEAERSGDYSDVHSIACDVVRHFIDETC